MGYCDAGTIVTDINELGLDAADECSCLNVKWPCVSLDDGSCSGNGWNPEDWMNEHGESPSEYCLNRNIPYCDGGVIVTDASQLAVEEVAEEEAATAVIAVQTASYGNEFSWEITSSGEVVCVGEAYESNTLYAVSYCDLDDGSYVLNCIDSYGDGWHGGHVTIEGNQYCGDFNKSNGEIPGTLMTQPFDIGSYLLDVVV